MSETISSSLQDTRLQKLHRYSARIEGIAEAIHGELTKTADVEFTSGLMGAMEKDAIEPLSLNEPTWMGVSLVCLQNPESDDMPEKIVCALGERNVCNMPLIPFEDGFAKWKLAMENIKKTLGLTLVEDNAAAAQGRHVYRVAQDAKGKLLPALLVNPNGDIHFN